MILRSRIFISVLILGAVPIPLFPATPAFTVDETENPIRVDGHLDDWPSARMIVLDQSSQLTLGKAYWKGKEDFSGRVFLTYDSQYLYVGAIVQKNGKVVNLSERPALWNGDCLELFLSTGPHPSGTARLTQGDYHIGFSPGTDCKDPEMFCFNKNKEIQGGRVVARTAKNGYVLEACVPLSFLAGLDLGPGKSAGLNLALDEGGPISGNRIVQLDLTGNFKSWRNPTSWGNLQWIGNTEVKVPARHETDLNASLVTDGTKGQAYFGTRNLKGWVLDDKGKPITGVKISTWPRTKETLTDESGAFELSRVKFYGNSVVYGKQTGYWTSLGLPGNKGIPITIRLTPIPRDFNSESGGLSGFFRGQSLIFPRNGDFASFLESRKESIAALRPQVLRLAGLESIANNQASVFAVIDRFIAFTKELGADPMIVIPTGKLQPQEASAWARYSNVEKNYGVRYWAIGDEPDLMLKGGGNLSGESNGLYDCINDFRTLYNALKTVDPNLVVLGPELAWKYSEGENDWLTPFLQYDGDIVNLISVHRYGCLADKPCSAKSIEENLRSEEAALWGISDKIAAQTDNFVPLVVTGGNSCLSFPVSAADEASPGGFEAALWMAEEMSILAQTGLGMGFLSSVKAEGTDGLFNGTGPQPVYWAQKLFGNAAKGKILDAQIPQADISLFATQEILSKDVRLLIVNKTDRYYHPKIYLNGKDGDLIVDAGLKQRVEYEIPSFSISCLKIKADNSPGEVVLYTRKLARADQAPVTSVLKPW